MNIDELNSWVYGTPEGLDWFSEQSRGLRENRDKILQELKHTKEKLRMLDVKKPQYRLKAGRMRLWIWT